MAARCPVKATAGITQPCWNTAALLSQGPCPRAPPRGPRVPSTAAPAGQPCAAAGAGPRSGPLAYIRVRSESALSQKPLGSSPAGWLGPSARAAATKGAESSELGGLRGPIRWSPPAPRARFPAPPLHRRGGVAAAQDAGERRAVRRRSTRRTSRAVSGEAALLRQTGGRGGIAMVTLGHGSSALMGRGMAGAGGAATHPTTAPMQTGARKKDSTGIGPRTLGVGAASGRRAARWLRRRRARRVGGLGATHGTSTSREYL